MEIKTVKGDLLTQEVDVIVNAWNRNIIPWWLLIPQGVSGAIKKKAGLEPFKELGKLGAIRLGQAVITCAGKLPYKAIIHVAGISMFWISSEKSIRESVTNALKLANENNYKSIAMPLIGAGTGGTKQQATLDIILDQLSKLTFDGRVIIVVFEK